MKSVRFFIVIVTVLGLLTTFVAPVAAQLGRVVVRSGYHPLPPSPPLRPYYPPHYHRLSDFEKTVRIIGCAAGVTAAALNSCSLND